MNLGIFLVFLRSHFGRREFDVRAAEIISLSLWERDIAVGNRRKLLYEAHAAPEPPLVSRDTNKIGHLLFKVGLMVKEND